MSAYKAGKAEHGVMTTSHISIEHAEGRNFPTAESSDGRYDWNSASDGYVRILDRAQPHSIDLDRRYGQSDTEISGEEYEAAHLFARAIEQVREDRRSAIRPKTEDGETKSGPCPKCGTYCYGDCTAS